VGGERGARWGGGRGGWGQLRTVGIKTQKGCG